MNMKQFLLIASVIAISVIATKTVLTTGIFSAANPNAPRPKKDIVIEFKLNDTSTALVATSKSHPSCKTGGEKGGCFKVKNKKVGVVKFEFTAPPAWELTKFMVCQRTTEITTTDPCNVPLTLDERLEFSVMESKSGGKILVTPESGVVDIAQLPAGAALREFYLFDQNTIKLKYVYSIEACNGSICVRLDPPVENTGTF